MCSDSSEEQLAIFIYSSQSPSKIPFRHIFKIMLGGDLLLVSDFLTVLHEKEICVSESIKVTESQVSVLLTTPHTEESVCR